MTAADLAPAVRALYPFAPRDFAALSGRMSYVDHGPRDGRPVLLLHGNPSWSFLWRDLILRLAAQGRRVIAPDHIGMGLSARPDRFLRLADRIADIEVTCLPKDLPEEITLDLSQMKLNESKYISDIPLPAGVVATAVMQGKDQVVVSIHSPRAEEPETPAAEAAAAATAAPAADAKKEEPKKEGAKK